jgi:nitronate monooxygenase
MAGGPSTPALAAAVTNAGGLGFLAGGMLSAEDLADAILTARTLTSGAVGVNLCVPEQETGSGEQISAYALTLERDAQHYGVALGEPRRDDDEWFAKLQVVSDLRPEVVSFTFGTPSKGLCHRLSTLGIMNMATVTTVHEAMIALSCGVDALVVQGPTAGGHRATFDAHVAPPDGSLEELVADLLIFCECPIVAAGGVGTRTDVRRLRKTGVAAVQLGTALLLADEAGTNPVHRAALRDPEFTQTVVTRAFTGRYGRALRNRFTETHDADAVFGFPEVAIITAPLQAAALKMADPQGILLWAGTAFRHARTGPAADIVRELAS